MKPVTFTSLVLACEGPALRPGDADHPFTATDECEVPGNVCTWLGAPWPDVVTFSFPSREVTLRTETYLDDPFDITFAEDGTAYYADYSSGLINKVGTDDLVTTVCGWGSLTSFGSEPQDCWDGCPSLEVSLEFPMDIAVSPTDPTTLWVVESGSGTSGRVDLLDLSTGVTSWWADGLGSPNSIVAADDGTLYVTDDITDWIVRISPEGVVATIAGPLDIGETRLALDGDMLWIADFTYNVVRTIDVAACAENASECAILATYGDGVFSEATDVAVAPTGDVYVADATDHCIRVLRTDGTIDVFAGRCTEAGYEGDGGAAIDALFNYPMGVAVNAEGNVFVADTYNSVVRRIVPLP